MDILAEIIARKRQRLAAAQAAVPLEQIRDAAIAARKVANPHALLAALKVEGINIIAEFKRRSPSKGTIREGADAATIARSYQAGGAVGVSVLTEEDYFSGSLEDFRAVRQAVSLPLLRKDFIVEEYQIYEAALAGADALLLIVAALDDETLTRLLRLAEVELGLDALVEVHDKQELDRAVAHGAKLIGVNNRNLRTFEVSTETSVDLAGEAPSDAVLVSESGLNPVEVHRLHAIGYKGFLVGEALMRAADPSAELRAFREAK
jgi:indole-3-glycerol phosphate synthase